MVISNAFQLNHLHNHNPFFLMRIFILNLEDGIQHVSRSCGIKTGFVENCVGLKPKYKNMEHCSFCDSDLCNGSNPVQHNNLWMTLIPAIVTVAIIKLSF